MAPRSGDLAPPGESPEQAPGATVAGEPRSDRAHDASVVTGASDSFVNGPRARAAPPHDSSLGIEDWHVALIKPAEFKFASGLYELH